MTFLLSVVPVTAAEPTGPVVLSVGGAVEARDGAAEFDLAKLKRLGVATLRTTTAWTDGTREFEGVPFAAVMRAVGARGGTAELEALNAYKVEVPIEEITGFDGLLAWSMDGRPLRVRDRGPLWLVFPREKYPDLASGSQNFKWIWQLRRITVK